jgi:hypothetical protein
MGRGEKGGLYRTKNKTPLPFNRGKGFQSKISAFNITDQAGICKQKGRKAI